MKANATKPKRKGAGLQDSPCTTAEELRAGKMPALAMLCPRVRPKGQCYERQ